MNQTKKCNLCFQHFSNQTELKNHSAACSIMSLDKRERKRAIAKDEEEADDITRNISFANLVDLVRELATRNDKLEKKVASLEKWVNTKKKRVNIEEWLTKHVIPIQSWSPWATSHFRFTDDQLDDFVSNNVSAVRLVEAILIEGLDSDLTTMPIQGFSHKVNELHIYTKNQDKELVWRRLDATDFKKLLIFIQRMICNKVTTWMNETRIEQKQMNQIMQHFAEIPSDQTHAAFGRFMSMMYQRVKQEFKSVVEFEI